MPKNLAKKKDTNKYWHLGGLINIAFSQASFTNWASGGQNQLGLTSLLSIHANYHKGKISWLNDAELGYGFEKQDAMPLQKTTDQIELTSSIGYHIFDSTSVSFLTNFQTQFAPGYTNTADTVLMSDFMSPAYWVIALGLTYHPVKSLYLFLSPVTARLTFVENQTLADAGDFGVTPAVYNSAGQLIQHGKKENTAFGAYFKGDYAVKAAQNISFNTDLQLFSNYLKDPQNIIVNWSNFLQLKVNKFISATINTQLIYDNNVNIPIYKVVNNTETLASNGPRVQFKEIGTIGFAYNIKGK
jgi:hypothetical protein